MTKKQRTIALTYDRALKIVQTPEYTFVDDNGIRWTMTTHALLEYVSNGVPEPPLKITILASDGKHEGIYKGKPPH